MLLYLKYFICKLFVKGKSDFFSDGYKCLHPECYMCGLTPWQHYVIEGKRKGYDNGNHPSDDLFFCGGYLAMYPDVAKSVYDPWHHYIWFGKKEGRDNGLHPFRRIFYADGYLRMYPDVANSSIDPWCHYVKYGQKEGRNNGNGFKTSCIQWPSAEHFESKNVLIIAELSLPLSKLYRVDQKVAALTNQGYNVYVSSWTDKTNCIKLMQFCSVVIFYRVPDFDSVTDCYKEAQRLDIHTIYDVDDLIFNDEAYRRTLNGHEIPEQYKAYLINDSKIYLSAMLKANDNWFSTKVLCDLSDKCYGTSGICIPNSIPQALSNASAEFVNKKKNTSTIRIFYGAASNYYNNVDPVHEVLEQILIKNENVELILIGDTKFNYNHLGLRKRVIITNRIGLKNYYHLLSQCDIAVIPLEQNLFNSAKSNVGYIEASMFSIPSVCADLYEFSSVIKNGKNGFIAKNKDEWAKYIQLLIDGEKERASIGAAARKNVLDRYSLTRLGARLASLIEPYAVNSNKKESILSVNIFYGVSFMGGATVVAERLAEEMHDNSNYDVHVFSTYTDLDDDIGNVRRYSYNGVNVWAVNIPSVSLSYSNEKIRTVFAHILNIVSPKLVHFHCIQTLGMDMCLECIERKLPYFVTIHDGWWNCARQFLVDKKGTYCGDEVSSSSMCKTRCDIQAADFCRKRNLAHNILVNAKKVYTPSLYFSALIQRNFPSVLIHTNKNGIIQKAKDSEIWEGNRCDKIVLGFFGGRELIKGYFFLKECMESFGSEIDNFKLILIDTSRRNGSEGYMKGDSWPVETEIIGYKPYNMMYQLYRMIDVLLFPSLWKESFGLVVREAIYNDVFVVCSDCGGPSEAIVNSENGLIFPMGDKDRFRECLRFLLKNKDFIKSYRTKNFGDVRTFKEQAMELLKDFDQVPSHSDLVSSINLRSGSAAAGA